MDPPFDQDAGPSTEDRPTQGAAAVTAEERGAEPRSGPVGPTLGGRNGLGDPGPGEGADGTGPRSEPAAHPTVEPEMERADDDRPEDGWLTNEPPTMPVPSVPDLSAPIVPAAPIIPPAPLVAAEPVVPAEPVIPPAPVVPAAPSSAGPAPSEGMRRPPAAVAAIDSWTRLLTRLTRWPSPVRAQSGHQLYSLVMLFVLAITVGVLAAGTLLVAVFVIVGALGHG